MISRSTESVRTDLQERFIDVLARSPEALQESQRFLDQMLRERGILFGDDVLPTFPVPFLAARHVLAGWATQAEELWRAGEELATEALRDRGLFDLLRLRPEARRYLEVDPGYRQIAVLARPDAIIRAGELVFVEFNCDSPAMMTFADEVSSCLLELPALAELRAALEPETRTERLLQALLDCYREFGGNHWPPTIAILDWEGQKTRYEHQTIAKRLEALGYPTVVGDPRALRRVEGRLELDGRRIHLVYRRALFSEIVEREREVQPLLESYRDGTICMVNSMRSYLASSKTMLAMLCERGAAGAPGFAACDRHLAKTIMVSPSTGAQMLAQGRGWVLKKAESHGGQHVLLPGLASSSSWTAAVEDSRREPWVLQEYCPVPRLDLPVVRDGVVVRDSKFFNWNPFIFGGRYSGSITRVSSTPLINISLGGGLLPTMTHR